MRLLVRPAPLPDECLPDFAGRVAALNGLKSDHAMRIALGSVNPSRCNSNYAALGESFPTGELKAMALRRLGAFTFQWRDVTFGRGRLRSKVVAICPQCLAESGARRIFWRLRHSRACLIHGCRLLERCPDCRREIRPGAGTTLRCVCRLDWRTVEASPASEALLVFQAAEEVAELSAYMRPSELLKWPVCHLPRDPRTAVLLDSMLGVLKVRDGFQERSVFARDSLVEEVGRLLAEGPEALAHTVTVVRWSLGHRTDDPRHGRILHRLRAIRHAADCDPDNQFLVSIAQYIKAGVADYHKCYRAAPSDVSKDGRDQLGYLNTSEAIRNCGLLPRTFDRLVKKGLIPSKEVRRGTRVVRRIIDCHVIAQLNEFRISLFDFREMSAYLGVSRELCSAIVKAGVLRGVWGERMRGRDMYRRADVERVLQRLTEVAAPVEARRVERIVALTVSSWPHSSPTAEGLLMALRRQVPLYVIDSQARGLNRWGISESACRQAKLNVRAKVIREESGGADAGAACQIAD